MAAMTATMNAKVTEPIAKSKTPEHEVLRLLRRFRMDRDEQAREALVLMHKGLVEKVARRFILLQHFLRHTLRQPLMRNKCIIALKRDGGALCTIELPN